MLTHFGGKGVNLDTPWRDIPAKARDKLLAGLGGERIRFVYRKTKGAKGWSHLDTFEGVIPMLQKRFRETRDDRVKEELSAFTAQVDCSDCAGTRLRDEARAVKLGGLSLPELTAMSVEDEYAFISGLTLTETEQMIGREALNEVAARLEFLINVGLKYVSLDRTAPTLSGGEAQRIRLASQIGSGLVGVLYVLDEPSIGLHHRDNHRLLNALCRLRDLGNTVIVVEHDEDTMDAADLIVDFGPGPGMQGGEVVVAGSVDEVKAAGASITGQFLSGERSIAIPEARRTNGSNGKQTASTGHWLEVVGARHNNLKDIDVAIPLGVFTCVTGVSGSGKSSLITDTLLPALTKHFFHAKQAPGEHSEIRGLDNIDKVIHIDQSAIGRTPRSNPATYTKAFDPIRKLFSDLPESQVRGYQQGRFSFNVREGRCDACDGNGATRVEMDFLSDVWVPCPVCDGNRFNNETLQIEYRGKSIADVLDMEVQDALDLFQNIPHVSRILQTLSDVGLDYMKLGQPSTTLSGGEAQRIKLAKELCRKSTGKTLYILDEPTTGLHFHDIDHLLEVLHRFTDDGNSVVVIEHNMDVIKTADWVIDLGPEGGEEGGLIVATGTPEDVARVDDSWTGQVLKQVLETGRTGGLQPLKGIALKAEAAGALTDVYQPIDRLTDITVTGAREHNLQNVSLAVPREKLVVFSGVSGSGKTSMALDTIYAEGQRRYVESLSSYARQFLGQVQKPRVDQIEGLSPAIAIEQKSASKNPRSTVGTITEVYDYVRVIWAQIADVYCPECQVKAGQQTSSDVIERLLRDYAGERVMMLAPVEPSKGEDHETILQRAARDGYLRARVDGEVMRIDEIAELDRRRTHVVELIVDRMQVNDDERGRLGEAVEAAFSRGSGRLVVALLDGSRELRLSQHLSCPSCAKSFEPLTPQMFAFNRAHDLSASGMCPACEGMGTQQGLAEEAVVGSRNRSVAQGAVTLWGKPTGQFRRMLEAAGGELGFDLTTPVAELSDAGRNALFYGDATKWITVEPDGFRFQYLGLFPGIDRALRAAPQIRDRLGQVLSDVPCSVCGGSRLQSQGRYARLRDVTIGELAKWPIRRARGFFDDLRLDGRETQIVGDILGEIQTRLRFLDEVGLEYISLDRRAPTLSGGEAQRIRLASQIGSGLTGVLYVLDEPTIGLHPRDNRRLLTALERLRDLNNTVIVVEHDSDTLNAADHIVDFGPGAGTSGGQVVASAAPSDIATQQQSLTGRYLAGQLAMATPSRRRDGNGAAVEVRGVRHHNLHDVSVGFPLGTMIVVTGVSGSGKSSLVNDVLYRALAAKLHRAQLVPGLHDEIVGMEHVDKVILIDQEPIGNSPLSNPATYSGVFDHLRDLFARIPESKVRGYTARRFSTNVPGGRCERCWGYGRRHIEMHFLPDVWVECDECAGMRYNRETLEVTFDGVSIGEVLQMSIIRALEHFSAVPRVRKLLQTLVDVGIGYMELGQAAPTLSGGEAQRLKLARELARPSTGKTMYILDEPTTGLHFDDVRRLLEVLARLVNTGNTVIMIEHNVGVMQAADWIVDLGPEGGDGGGNVVVAGTPETVAACTVSHTGSVLREALAGAPFVEPRGVDDAQFAPIQDDDDGAGSGKPVPNEKPPWKVDGKAWHVDTERPRGNSEKPATWDAAVLERLVALVEESVPARVSWTNKVRVTIWTAEHSAPQWCNILTDDPDVVRFDMYVPTGSIDDRLCESVGFHSVAVNDWYGGLVEWTTLEKEVRETSHTREEDFSAFLRAGHQAFVDAIDEFKRQREGRTSGEAKAVSDDSAIDVRPEPDDRPASDEKPAWKIDGEAWHLDPDRERRGQEPAWSPEIVRRIVTEIAERLEVRVTWQNQLFVTIRPRKYTWGVWCRIFTCEPDTVRFVLHAPADLARGSAASALGFDVIERPHDWMGIEWVWTEKSLVQNADIDAPGLAELISESYDRFVAGQDRHVERDRAEHVPVEIDPSENTTGLSEDDETAPWKSDGRAWHTDPTRARSTERPPAWEPEALVHAVETAVAIDGSTVVWENKTLVSVWAEGAGRWLEIKTDDWRQFRMRFRVPNRSFNGDELRRRLGLRPFDEIDDLPVGGRRVRVRVQGHAGDGLVHVDVVGCLKREIDNDAFAAFVREAHDAFVSAARSAEE